MRRENHNTSDISIIRNVRRLKLFECSSEHRQNTIKDILTAVRVLVNIEVIKS